MSVCLSVCETCWGWTPPSPEDRGEDEVSSHLCQGLRPKIAGIAPLQPWVQDKWEDGKWMDGCSSLWSSLEMVFCWHHWPRSRFFIFFGLSVSMRKVISALLFHNSAIPHPALAQWRRNGGGTPAKVDLLSAKSVIRFCASRGCAVIIFFFFK